MTTPHMPYPRERTAPRFSSSHARELARFFADLEYLFATCRITSDRIKKDHTVRYMSIDDEEIWVSVPEFDSDTATFDEFKTAIFRSYPEANDLYRYSRNDLIALAIASQHRGISSVFDLAEYTRSFRGIASILIKCELSSHLDAQNIYIQGFRRELLSDIIFRLHTIDPTLILAPSYSIDQVYKAATWIFEARSTMVHLPSTSTPSLAAPIASIAPVAPVAYTASVAPVAPTVPRITASITPVASPKIPVPSRPSNPEIFKLQDHVAYAPPAERNFAALPDKKYIPRKLSSTPSSPPISEDSTIIAPIYPPISSAPNVSITLRELLSLAPSITAHYCEATTPSRDLDPIPEHPVAATNLHTSAPQPLFFMSHSTPIDSRTPPVDLQPSAINLRPPPIDPHPCTVVLRPQPVDSRPQSVRPHTDAFQPISTLFDPSRPCSVVPRTRNITSSSRLIAPYTCIVTPRTRLVNPRSRLVALSFYSFISYSSSRCISPNITQKPRRRARQARYQHPRRRIDPHRPRVVSPRPLLSAALAPVQQHAHPVISSRSRPSRRAHIQFTALQFVSPCPKSSRRVLGCLVVPGFNSLRPRSPRRPLSSSRACIHTAGRHLVALKAVSPRTYSIHGAPIHLAAPIVNSQRSSSSRRAPRHLIAPQVISLRLLSSHRASGRLTALHSSRRAPRHLVAPQVISLRLLSSHRASGRLTALQFVSPCSKSFRRASFGPPDSTAPAAPVVVSPHLHSYSMTCIQLAGPQDVSPRPNSIPRVLVHLVALSSRRAPRHLIAPQVILTSHIHLATLQDVSPRPYLISQALVISPRPLASRRTSGRLVVPQLVSSCPMLSRRDPTRLVTPQVASSRYMSSGCVPGRLAVHAFNFPCSRRLAALQIVSPHVNSTRRMPIRLAALQFVSPRSPRRARCRLATRQVVSSHYRSSRRAPTRQVTLQSSRRAHISLRRAHIHTAASQSVSSHPKSFFHLLGCLVAPGLNLPRSRSTRRARSRSAALYSYSSAPNGLAALQGISPRFRLSHRVSCVSPRLNVFHRALLHLVALQFVSLRSSSSRRTAVRLAALQLVSSHLRSSRRASGRIIVPQVISLLTALQLTSPRPPSSRRAPSRLVEPYPIRRTARAPIRLATPNLQHCTINSRHRARRPPIAAHSLSATRVKRPFYYWITPSPRMQLSIPRRRCPSLVLQSVPPRFRLTADSQKFVREEMMRTASVYALKTRQNTPRRTRNAHKQNAHARARTR
ncbi:hypothetical protein BJ912DRAFT_1063183 [Pholiota molesta]|nr:hypothetical protein BJ912DRAFT_1063183 [Pholiota molesta]